MSFRVVPKESGPHQFDDTTEPFATIKQFTTDPIGRLYLKRTFASEVFQRQIEGDIVSCGACNGGTAALLAHTALTRRNSRPRHTWLFDSFEGMPEPGDEDGAESWLDTGERLGSIDACRQAMKQIGVGSSHYTIVPGWFEQTYPNNNVDRISVLHIDVGQHDAELISLQAFYDRVEPGGLILLDDYGSWSGCRKAIDSFFGPLDGVSDIIQIDDSSYYVFKQHAPYLALNDKN